MVSGGFLSVCPIHLRFLFFISFSMGSCLVIFQSVVIGTLCVHFRCRILRRHLLMKVCIVLVSSVYFAMSPIRRVKAKSQRDHAHAGYASKARDNASARLDQLTSDVSRLQEDANIFRDVREMTKKPVAKLTIHDDTGLFVCSGAKLNARLTDHFSRQFNDSAIQELSVCISEIHHNCKILSQSTRLCELSID